MKEYIKNTNIDRYEITNEDQAVQWVESLVAEMVVWRQKCDLKLPDRTGSMVRQKQRDLWTFLTKHGQVVGALKALKMAKLISDKAYLELNQKALNTLIPTVIKAND